MSAWQGRYLRFDIFRPGGPLALFGSPLILSLIGTGISGIPCSFRGPRSRVSLSGLAHNPLVPLGKALYLALAIVNTGTQMTKPIPNYNRFDFDSFISSVLDLGFIEMFNALQSECARVEASMRGRGGPQARADGGADYVARLKRVLFWFHHGVLADHGQESATCHRIAEKLVEKKHLKPGALRIFQQP